MPEKVKKLNRTCEYCGNQMNSWDAKLTKALQSKNCCENCFCKIYDMDKEAFRETMENYLGIRPCMGI